MKSGKAYVVVTCLDQDKFKYTTVLLTEACVSEKEDGSFEICGKSPSFLSSFEAASELVVRMMNADAASNN